MTQFYIPLFVIKGSAQSNLIYTKRNTSVAIPFQVVFFPPWHSSIYFSIYRKSKGRKDEFWRDMKGGLIRKELASNQLMN